MKHKKYYYLLILVFSLIKPSSTSAQIDTVNISVVEITSSRIPSVYSESSRIVHIIGKEQIDDAAVSDLQDLLRFIPGTDGRQRGPDGVQSDISIRGGTFDQVLILLNGIPINDVQTGHHNLNLPVDIQDIQRIEILEGPGCQAYGTNAFSGAINIITGNDTDKNLILSLSGGEYNYFGGFISYSQQIRNLHNYLSFSRKQSDGYMSNTDYKIGRFFYQSELKMHKSLLAFYAGYADKAFGANSFYSSVFPHQFEYTKTTLLGLKWNTKGFLKGGYNIYWRRNQDRFELFRSYENAPAWYTKHNYHLTNVYGVSLNYSFQSVIGKTAFGAEFRNEEILSNVLGDSLNLNTYKLKLFNNLNDSILVPGESNVYFYKGKARQNISFFAEQRYHYQKISAGAGMLINWFSDNTWKVYPALEADFSISKKIKLITTVNQSMRQPNFTELYYNSATNTGNPLLMPETSLNYEIGSKYLTDILDIKMVLFRREGKNLIDWVKYPDSSKWESKNITEINTNGIETGANVNLLKLTRNNNFFIKYIYVSYTYLDASRIENEFMSKYVLDYLVHKADCNFKHRLIKNVFAVWNVSFQQRNGTYVDVSSQKEIKYKAVYLINSKVYWQNRQWQIFIEASNLLNKSYYDFGNIPLPGRWIRGGVLLDLNLNTGKS